MIPVKNQATCVALESMNRLPAKRTAAVKW